MNEAAKPAALADYPSALRLPIQWGDQDAMGHVNNTVYLRWFETGRIAYFSDCQIDAMLDEMKLGPILASVTCHYRQQLVFPETIWIGSRVSAIGNSSLTLQHAIYSETLGEIAADGEGIVVVFDYESNRPVRAPDLLREAIARFEGVDGF